MAPAASSSAAAASSSSSFLGLSSLRSPIVLALVALVVVQQGFIMGKLTISIGGGGGVRVGAGLGGDDHGDAEAAKVAAEASHTVLPAEFDTGTGTPPRYTGDPKTSAVLFFFCPGGGDDDNSTVRFVEQSVMSSRAAGFERHHIVVIDTSPDTHCYHRSAFLRREVGYVYPTIPTDLTFAMLHNVAWRLADRWGFPHYFWQHADVFITHEGETEAFATKAMRVVADETPPDWGMVHFAYDLFACYKTEAVAKVRWDQGIHHYLADCDFHIRIQFAGYSIIQSFAGIVLHMKALLPEPVSEIKSYSMEYYKEHGAFETRPVKLNRIKHSTNPNGKIGLLTKTKPRLDVQGVKDISNNATETKYRLASEASNEYYRLKWGSHHCNWNPGKIETIGRAFPAFDINDASTSHRRASRPANFVNEQSALQKGKIRIKTSISRGGAKAAK